MSDRGRDETGGLGLRRAPVAALPALHQIVLPTPWPVGSPGAASLTQP